MEPTHPATHRAQSAVSVFAELPRDLFFRVLLFALCDDSAATEWTTRTMAEELERIGDVCVSWCRHTTALESQMELSSLLLVVETGTRQELLEKRRQLTLRHKVLRKLRLCTGAETRDRQWFARVTKHLVVGLAHAPELEILDLRSFEATNEDAADLVRAAAKFCLSLQSLFVPIDPGGRRDGLTGISNDRPLLMDAVSFGLKQWHIHGWNGGLRQLRVPQRPSTSRFKHSVEFLNCVSRHCPNIELLEGYSFLKRDGIRDQYIVDRTTWRQLCKSCRHLREFDWKIAPWATDFFEIFGRFTKPQLTEMVLTTSRSWNWESYFQEIGADEATAIRRSGYGSTARNAFKIIEGCPALTKLRIVLHAPIDGAVRDGRDMFRGFHMYEEDTEDPLPEVTLNPLNQDLFGDDLCKALARACPLLSELTMTYDNKMGEIFAPRLPPIMTFTDRGVYELAHLRFLSRIDIQHVNIRGETLFMLLNSPYNEAPGKRYFTFTIGDDEESLHHAFFIAVEILLQDLIDHDGPLDFSKKKTVFRIIHGKLRSETAEFSQYMYKRLRDLLMLVRYKYPKLKVRMAISGLENGTFRRMSAFAIVSGGIVPEDRFCWDGLPKQALVDGVFVREELLGAYGDDSDEEEDEEQSPYAGFNSWEEVENYYDEDHSLD